MSSFGYRVMARVLCRRGTQRTPREKVPWNEPEPEAGVHVINDWQGKAFEISGREGLQPQTIWKCTECFSTSAALGPRMVLESRASRQFMLISF